jgi:hypothetical protein
VPAAVALILAFGAGAYLGLSGKNGPGSNTTTGIGATTHPSVTALAGQATGTATASTSPSASATPAASASDSVTPSASAAPVGAVSSTTYTTTEPFPLCDPNGATWSLVNLTPGSCGQNMQPTANSQGYSFGAVSSLPRGVPALTGDNTVTVTGTVSEGGGSYCLGPARGPPIR